jgi:hypothetical protein
MFANFIVAQAIKTWYRNHMKTQLHCPQAGANGAVQKLTRQLYTNAKNTGSCTRLNHAAEVYSKLFYISKHKESVDEQVGPRLAEESEIEFNARWFNVLRSTIQEGWQNATADEKQAVENFMAKQKNEKDTIKKSDQALAVSRAEIRSASEYQE